MALALFDKNLICSQLPITKVIDFARVSDLFARLFPNIFLLFQVDPTDHFLMSLSESYQGDAHPEACRFRQKVGWSLLFEI